MHVLLRSGASPHTHEPRPSDVRRTSSASVVFYGSPTLDGWAAGLEAPNRVAMLSLLPDSLLIRGTGEQADPHFWMDPMAVRGVLSALSDTLCALVPDRCADYQHGAATFADDLIVVHDSVSALMREMDGLHVLVTHPFLAYFARRYDLHVAGIVEELPGSEPTAADMMRMIDAAKSSEARAILTVPQHSTRVAGAIAEATGLPIIELDPMGGDVDGYAELLYFNASRIRTVLSSSPSLR